MTRRAREWRTVEEHVADTLHHPDSSESSQQEAPVSSPFTAALAFVHDQAAVLEADVNGNQLSVILAARHVGKTFSAAECIAIADFLHAIEAENRAQAQALAPYQDMASSNGHVTGPQRILP